ncbi:hypothetical protein FOA52_009604 [Chlamydomonas sp. UWO 241]|nr:hypothetical protein FOA52_009604 [Chlamydomonas sp. UWO 241]
MPTHAAHAAEDPRLRNLADRKITSNLFLQQLLYYGLIFDVGWILFWWIWLFATYWQGITYKDPDVVRTVGIILWLIFNPIRMFAGWYGNTQETLPWIILFCILTLLPLHVTIYYLMIAGYDGNSLTKSVQYCQAVLYDTQFVVGIYTCFRMYWLQKRQFYLFEFVMNKRRRNEAYRVETERERSSSGGGGIGRGR